MPARRSCNNKISGAHNAAVLITVNQLDCRGTIDMIIRHSLRLSDADIW